MNNPHLINGAGKVTAISIAVFACLFVALFHSYASPAGQLDIVNILGLTGNRAQSSLDFPGEG